MGFLDALDDGVNGLLAILGYIAVGTLALAFVVSFLTNDPGPATNAAVQYEVDEMTNGVQTLAWLVGAFGTLGVGAFLLGLWRGWWELPG